MPKKSKKSSAPKVDIFGQAFAHYDPNEREAIKAQLLKIDISHYLYSMTRSSPSKNAMRMIRDQVRALCNNKTVIEQIKLLYAIRNYFELLLLKKSDSKTKRGIIELVNKFVPFVKAFTVDDEEFGTVEIRLDAAALKQETVQTNFETVAYFKVGETRQQYDNFFSKLSIEFNKMVGGELFAKFPTTVPMSLNISDIKLTGGEDIEDADFTMHERENDRFIQVTISASENEEFYQDEEKRFIRLSGGLQAKVDECKNDQQTCDEKILLTALVLGAYDLKEDGIIGEYIIDIEEPLQERLIGNDVSRVLNIHVPWLQNVNDRVLTKKVLANYYNALTELENKASQLKAFIDGNRYRGRDKYLKKITLKIPEEGDKFLRYEEDTRRLYFHSNTTNLDYYCAEDNGRVIYYGESDDNDSLDKDNRSIFFCNTNDGYVYEHNKLTMKHQKICLKQHSKIFNTYNSDGATAYLDTSDNRVVLINDNVGNEFYQESNTYYNDCILSERQISNLSNNLKILKKVVFLCIKCNESVTMLNLVEKFSPEYQRQLVHWIVAETIYNERLYIKYYNVKSSPMTQPGFIIDYTKNVFSVVGLYHNHVVLPKILHGRLDKLKEKFISIEKEDQSENNKEPISIGDYKIPSKLLAYATRHLDLLDLFEEKKVFSSFKSKFYKKLSSSDQSHSPKGITMFAKLPTSSDEDNILSRSLPIHDSDDDFPITTNQDDSDSDDDSSVISQHSWLGSSAPSEFYGPKSK